MAGKARDHVEIAVAVDVIGVHLGAAGAEGVGMLRPGWRGRAGGHRGGLFPPSAGHEEIGPAVAVDVADAKAVLILPPGLLLGAGGEGPALGARLLRRGGKPENAAGVEDELRLAVAGDVEEIRGLVVDDRMDEVLGPSPLGGLHGGGVAAGVFEPSHLLAGPLVDEDVEPAVAVDVADAGHEVVGVLVGVEILGGVDLVAFLEFRSGIPVGAVDGVAVAILVDVADPGRLGMKLRV